MPLPAASSGAMGASVLGCAPQSYPAGRGEPGGGEPGSGESGGREPLTPVSLTARCVSHWDIHVTNG